MGHVGSLGLELVEIVYISALWCDICVLHFFLIDSLPAFLFRKLFAELLCFCTIYIHAKSLSL